MATYRSSIGARGENSVELSNLDSRAVESGSTQTVATIMYSPSSDMGALNSPVSMTDNPFPDEPDAITPVDNGRSEQGDAADVLHQYGPPHNIHWWNVFIKFIGFGLRAWGGPMAQLGLLKHQLVEEEKWISIERFNKVLAVYQALPGPEATEMCCYFGMVACGRPGAMAAGIGFIIPGLLLMLLACVLYDNYGLNSPYVLASFHGMKPVVSALMFRAAHRIGESALTNQLYVILAVGAALQSVLRINFFFSLLHGAVCAYLFPFAPPSVAATPSPSSSSSNKAQPALSQSSSAASSADAPQPAPVSLLARCNVYFPFILFNSACLLAFIIYVAVTGGLPPAEFVGAGFTVDGNSIGSLFLLSLIAGLVTFGGAYTAIPVLRQSVVIAGQWLTMAVFVDGVAIASMLPAPLVIFITFLGYMIKGVGGALIMTFGMFLPAFLFTLVGHNFFERIVNHGRLTRPLEGITACVIGLMVLAAWQLLRATVTAPPDSVLFLMCLAILYKVNHPYLASALVLLGAIAGQALYAPE